MLAKIKIVFLSFLVQYCSKKIKKYQENIYYLSKARTDFMSKVERIEYNSKY